MSKLVIGFYAVGMSFLLTGCMSLERHPASGYGDTAFYTTDGPTPHFATMSTKERIRSLEKTLTEDREKRQYYNSLPWLKDEDEQLAMLSLSNYESRQQWLRDNRIGQRATQLDEDTLGIIEQKDITLGMPQEFVRKSWGAPDAVETAGNPVYRNERWKYKRYISSSEGYQLESRTIYFEGGKVVGWEKINH